MFAFVAIAIYGLSQMADSADAADCTWEGDIDEQASTAGNWQNGTVPNNNDILYFINGSDCHWDVNKYASKVIVKSTYTNDLIIDGQSLTIADNLINYGNIQIVYPKAINHWGYSTSQVRNYGYITGDGPFNLWPFNADTSHYFGNIEILEIVPYYTVNRDCTIKMLSDTNCDLFWIYSDSGTYKVIFDTNGFVLNAHNITGLIRSEILGKDIIVHDILAPYDYNFDNLTVSNTLIMSKSITIDNSLTLNGQWDKIFYYNGSMNIQTDQQHWTGWLYTDDDVKVQYNTASYLQMNHGSWLGLQMNSWSGTDNFTFNITGTEDNVQFACSRMTASAMYDLYEGGIYTQTVQTNTGGVIGFTTDVTTGDYLISKSSYLPASVDYGPTWLGLAIAFFVLAVLVVLSFWRREFAALAGFGFLGASLFLFVDYGNIYLFLGVGVGMMLIFMGLEEYVK
jgi:hypothetical protein